MIKSLIRTLILFAPVLCSCSENDGPDAPGLPPEPGADGQSALTASYSGKHFRLAGDMNFNGAITDSWTDTVWQNDRIHNQIILKNSGAEIRKLTFAVTPLSGHDYEISADNIRLRGVKMVAGDAAPAVDAQPSPRPLTYVGDALSETLPQSILPGQTEAIWLSVDVPDGCPPGSYSGSVDILSDTNLLASCKINILVTSHRLPDPCDWTFHLDIWQFPFQLPTLISQNGGGDTEMFSQKYFDLMRPFYSILADAGQKSITAYIKDGAFQQGQTMVGWTLRANGTWNFDYTGFDRYVEFMDGLGINRQISCFSLAGWNNFIGYTDESDGGKYKYMQLTVGSDEFNSVWSSFLNDFRSHLQSKGWLARTVLFMDENTNDEIHRIVNLIRENGSDWKIGFSGRYIDADVEREFYNYAAIIGSPMNTTAIDIPLFYTSCSQTHPNNYITPLTSPAEMTWMAWHAMAKGFKGYQRWAFDYWTRPDELDARDRGNTAGDFHMIYRSGNSADATPVGSIRWEMLREGIQDYEKARILGMHKLRTVILPFSDSEAANAPAYVNAAQAELKRLSVL
ncbi:MAG: DUF4091 domain-containing protein [Muribaculaceae bacterium]|nr:DUF4091 domain-containing protein [Muribaculaceae bacterium]